MSGFLCSDAADISENVYMGLKVRKMWKRVRTENQNLRNDEKKRKNITG